MENFKRKSGAGFISNIVAIVVVLGIVFFSQQAYFAPYGKTLYLKGIGEFNVYWLKIDHWANANVYPKIGGEVGRGREQVTQEIVKHKNNIAQNIWENVKSYLAQKFSKYSGTEVK